MYELAHILAQAGAHVQEDDLAALRGGGALEQREQPGIEIPRSVGQVQLQKAELAQAWVRVDLPGAVALGVRIGQSFSICHRRTRIPYSPRE